MTKRLEQEIDKYLGLRSKKERVVLIVGADATGKTTLGDILSADKDHPTLRLMYASGMGDHVRRMSEKNSEAFEGRLCIEIQGIKPEERREAIEAVRSIPGYETAYIQMVVMDRSRMEFDGLDPVDSIIILNTIGVE